MTDLVWTDPVRARSRFARRLWSLAALACTGAAMPFAFGADLCNIVRRWLIARADGCADRAFGVLSRPHSMRTTHIRRAGWRGPPGDTGT